MFARKHIALLALLLLLSTGLAAKAGPAASEASECFPGTEPRAPQPHHCYLPLIIGEENQPPPLPVCSQEIEPNDTHTDAQVVATACVDGAAAWDGDADWYRLKVCSQVTLVLSLEASGSGALDLDLYLHPDPPGWPLHASERPGTASERITATNLLTGTYYVLVQHASGAGDYRLFIQATR